MDQVWKRMKKIARDLGERDSSLSLAEARAIILQLSHEADGEAPPEPALEFLANEFVVMVKEHTAQLH